MEERRRKLQLSTQHLLKEAREKSRGWESHSAPEHVELAYKKVNRGRKEGELINRCFSPELHIHFRVSVIKKNVYSMKSY